MPELASRRVERPDHPAAPIESFLFCPFLFNPYAQKRPLGDQPGPSHTNVKPPRSLKITDISIGTGRPCVPGDVALCHCVCKQHNGDTLFASELDHPYSIRVGGRDCLVGIEYGLLGMQVGGIRTVVVPHNLTYGERRMYTALPDNAMVVYDLTLLALPEKWDSKMEARLSNRNGSDGIT